MDTQGIFTTRQALQGCHVAMLFMDTLEDQPSCPRYRSTSIGDTGGAGWVYLETPIESPLDGDAFGGVGAVGGDCCDERVQLISLLLQLLYQRLYGSLAECF